MNPFELTKDPDGGGTTVRVKHGFVVLTREEEKQITERITEILTENAKLRKYAESYAKSVECEGCGWCPYDMDALCDIETMPMRDGCRLYDELRELRIEVD